MQHALEKLVPGIHFFDDKSDLELRQAFIIKLQPTIQKEILGRAVKYESLQELISVEERFESVIVGTTKRDWMPQPHDFPATAASSNPISTGGRCFPRKLCLPVDNFFSLVTFHNWVLAKFSISKIRNRRFLVAMVTNLSRVFFCQNQ